MKYLIALALVCLTGCSFTARTECLVEQSEDSTRIVCTESGGITRGPTL